MTTSLTAAQLDELEAYLDAQPFADRVGGFTNVAHGNYYDLNASVLRELLALGRRELERERRVPCSCGRATVLDGGAYREPSGFTHYSLEPCGPDLLGNEDDDDDRCPACAYPAGEHDPEYACHPDHPDHGRFP